jgi:hypothetical protein
MCGVDYLWSGTISCSLRNRVDVGRNSEHPGLVLGSSASQTDRIVDL